MPITGTEIQVFLLETAINNRKAFCPSEALFVRNVQADINGTSSSGRERDIPAGQLQCQGAAEKGVKWTESGNTGMWVRFSHSGEEQARQCSESSMCGMRNTGPGGEEGPLVARKHPRGQKMYSGAHRVPGMSHLQLPGPVHSVASSVPYSHGINALKRYVGEAGAGANAWVSQRSGGSL